MPFNHLDFFVIGAQKCATSWMYYCLNEHPEINIPSKKMEIGYIGGAIFQEKGETWFFNRFPAKPSAKICGDVSVEYLLDQRSAKNILQYVNQPKFIAVLRNPVDRMISAYFWSVRKKQIPNKNIEFFLKHFLKDPKVFSKRHSDKFIDELFRRGFYGEQLEPFLTTYGGKCLMVFLYDEICNNPEQVVRRMYRFLGVNDSFIPSILKVRPKVNSYNSFLLFLENITRMRAWAKIIDHLNRLLVKKVGRKEPVSCELRAELHKLFLPHLKKAEQILLQLPVDQRPPDCRLTKVWSN